MGSKPTPDADPRPGLWFGHLSMTVADPARSHDFYVGLGMRTVLCRDDFAITEVRGGTHLILAMGDPDPSKAPFDLMVEDLPATHATFVAAGAVVGPIVEGEIHNVFELTDPDGYTITVSNSHVVGPV